MTHYSLLIAMSTWYNANLVRMNMEQELYQALEKRFKSRIEYLINENLVKTCLTCVLEMILHLRQGA